MSDPIRIFVGCAANHEDLESQAVLEWSIRKHASRAVEIEWMKLSRDPASFWYSGTGMAQGWNTTRWATPFSGFRWGIPAFCGFEGKAIYTDSDVIFMADPAGLFDQAPAPGAMLVAKGGGQWRICVSMWDCAAAKAHLPEIDAIRRDPEAHRKLCHLVKKPGLVSAFSGEWNCLDRELGARAVTDPSIKAIHYTDMRAQPQLRHAVPRLSSEGKSHWFDGHPQPGLYPKIDALFDAMLDEAKANGYGPERYANDPPFGRYLKKSLAA